MALTFYLPRMMTYSDVGGSLTHRTGVWGWYKITIAGSRYRIRVFSGSSSHSSNAGHYTCTTQYRKHSVVYMHFTKIVLYGDYITYNMCVFDTYTRGLRRMYLTLTDLRLVYVMRRRHRSTSI